MSRVLKYNRIVLGEPLEIQDSTMPYQAEECTAGDGEIKENSDTESEQIRVQIMKTAEHEKKAILEEASRRARQIMDDAAEKAEGITREAFNKGYEEGQEKGYMEGLQNGRKEGLETVAALEAELLEAKKNIAEMKERALREAEGKIVELVLDISRKVIGRQIDTDREAVLSIIRKAMNRCPVSSKVNMRIAPEDYDIVLSSKDKLLREAETVSELEIVMDNSLAPGSCVLETEAGFIDTSVETQLNRIEKSFKELLNYEQY